MKTLDRYLGLSVAQSALLVMLALAGLFALIDLVEQLEDLGEGDYGLTDALLYVVLLLPRRMLELAPVTALLGGCIALGSLANHSELIAMRAAGVSMLRITGSVLRVGMIFMLAVIVLEEFIAPPLQQYAQKQRSLAQAGRGDVSAEAGFWSRNGQSFINVRSLRHGRVPADIDIYQFDDEGRLQSYIHAASADISQPQYWQLREVTRKTLAERSIETRQLPQLRWRSFLTEAQVRALEPSAESLAPSALYGYIQYLKAGGQRANGYELTLWRKLSLPLTIIAMLALAIPFVLGLPRLKTLAQRVMGGVLIGIGFYFLERLIGNVGLLLDISAPLIALAPAVLALALATLLWRRIY